MPVIVRGIVNRKAMIAPQCPQCKHDTSIPTSMPRPYAGHADEPYWTGGFVRIIHADMSVNHARDTPEVACNASKG